MGIDALQAYRRRYRRGHAPVALPWPLSGVSEGDRRLHWTNWYTRALYTNCSGPVQLPVDGQTDGQLGYCAHHNGIA